MTKIHDNSLPPDVLRAIESAKWYRDGDGAICATVNKTPMMLSGNLLTVYLPLERGHGKVEYTVDADKIRRILLDRERRNADEAKKVGDLRVAAALARPACLRMEYQDAPPIELVHAIESVRLWDTYVGHFDPYMSIAADVGNVHVDIDGDQLTVRLPLKPGDEFRLTRNYCIDGEKIRQPLIDRMRHEEAVAQRESELVRFDREKRQDLEIIAELIGNPDATLEAEHEVVMTKKRKELKDIEEKEENDLVENEKKRRADLGVAVEARRKEKESRGIEVMEAIEEMNELRVIEETKERELRDTEEKAKREKELRDIVQKRREEIREKELRDIVQKRREEIRENEAVPSGPRRSVVAAALCRALEPAPGELDGQTSTRFGLLELE